MSLETIEPIADVETEATVRVGCTATEHVSLAYHENAIPVIREIVVANPSDRDLVDLLIRVESRPAVVQPLTLRIDRIPAGANHHIEAPDLRLDAALLAGFTEASRLELTTILEEAGSACTGRGGDPAPAAFALGWQPERAGAYEHPPARSLGSRTRQIHGADARSVTR